MNPRNLLTIVFLAFFTLLVRNVDGHGHIHDPPGRSSMGNQGFDVPKNSNENALNCGSTVWQQLFVNQLLHWIDFYSFFETGSHVRTGQCRSLW